MMPGVYNNGMYWKGDEHAIAQLNNLLDCLNQKDKIFTALVGIPAGSAADAFADYFGVRADVKKAEFDYTLHSPTEIYANMETKKDIPRGFFQKLSAQYGIMVDVEYDCANDNICGKIRYEGGQFISDEKYTFPEGKYRLDTDPEKANFWHELQIITEDVYQDTYEDATEVLQNELTFFNKQEQKRFIELYDNL